MLRTYPLGRVPTFAAKLSSRDTRISWQTLNSKFWANKFVGSGMMVDPASHP